MRGTVGSAEKQIICDVLHAPVAQDASIHGVHFDYQCPRLCDRFFYDEWHAMKWTVVHQVGTFQSLSEDRTEEKK